MGIVGAYGICMHLFQIDNNILQTLFIENKRLTTKKMEINS